MTFSVRNGQGHVCMTFLQRLLLFRARQTTYLARVCYICSFWGGRLGINFFFLGGGNANGEYHDRVVRACPLRNVSERACREWNIMWGACEGRLGVRRESIRGVVDGTARPGTRCLRVVQGVGDVKVGQSLG